MASLIQRYLARYGSDASARPGAIRDRSASYRPIENLPPRPGSYRFVLTIPAYDEPADFLPRVLAETRDRVLTIVTVNAPDDAAPAALSRTRRLLETLTGEPDVLVIDRVSTPLPRRQGVGLARKLAADLACALIDRGDVSCPLIFMTDADAVLPAGYFDAVSTRATRGTYIYPYRHQAAEKSLQAAADLYELHMRWYARGLADAGSPYAYQTLGSTIAIHAETYAAIRGVPRRNAGEDFYLLNKAAKVAPIFTLAEPVITLAARPSHRVPFGTGPALAAMPADVETFLSYPATAFEDLGTLLTRATGWSLHGGPLVLPVAVLTALEPLGWAPERLAERYPRGPRLLRALLEWFDGFRTMRFIRARQAALPPAPLLATLRSALAMPGADPAALLRALAAPSRVGYLGVAAALEKASAEQT